MQTEILKVTGMTCGGYTSKVTRALKAIAGVNDVKVSLSSGEATVKYDEHKTSPDLLKSVVRDAGYEVGVATDTHKQKGKGGCCG